MPICVGLDWADDHHDLCILTSDGEELAVFRFDHSAEGLELLHSTIRQHEADPDNVFLAIETPHGLLVDSLLEHGYRIYAINPKAADRYRDRIRPSGSKDDVLDARNLAEIMRTDRHRHRQLVLPSEQYYELGLLCDGLRKVIQENTRLSNQLVACLKGYYPQAVDLFSVANSSINIAFLRKYPDPNTLAGLSHSSFLAFLKDQKYPAPKSIPRLWQRVSAKAPKPSAPALVTGKMRMMSLIDQLEVTRKHVRLYEEQIQQILEDLPEADTFSSLPGSGARITPEITAAFGPNMEDAPKLFHAAKELARLSGCAPITVKSGKFKSVRRRLACDKNLNRTFYELARCSVSKSAWAKAYFHDCIDRAVRVTTIYRSLACKWIKIAFHLWKTGALYDEDYHIEQLKLRGVRWAMSL